MATVLAVAWAFTAAAQTEPFAMSDSTVTSCIGELTDSGGPNEAYGNNEDLTFTIDAGAPLEVGFFGAIDIESAAPGSGLLFDFLVLYDGPTTNAPVLDTLFGSIANPPNYSTQGALTVQFVSDASAQPQGFHLFWSANPPPPTPPMTTLDGPGSCPFSALQWSFTPPVECALIDWASLSIAGADGSNWPVDTAAAQLLSCPGGTGNTLTLPLGGGATIAGNCDILATLTIGLRDACDSVWNVDVAAEWTASGCSPAPILSVSTDTLCTGGCTELTATARGCGPTTFVLMADDGTSVPGPGPWTLCPETSTVYSVTATETETGNAGLSNVAVTVIELGAWTGDTALCPGQTLDLSNGPIAGEWSGQGVSGPPWMFYADSSGSGIHDLVFSADGSAGCSSSTSIEVVDFVIPQNLATCPESAPFELEGSPQDGIWTGPGLNGSTFDPSWADSVLGSSPYTLTYAAQGCSGQTLVHVETLADTLELDNVCASEPDMPLPTTPPGGQWSGPGWDAQNGIWSPSNTPFGPFTLTYSMEGCNGTAYGVILPVEAGPTSTSCPEQLPFVPFENFYPPGGFWSGPGIDSLGTISGEYDPSLLMDGQWAPLVYAAPNGCSDTLWMFNRQTQINPDLIHACSGDPENLLAGENVQASPWCGTWTTLTSGDANDLGDCQWEILAGEWDTGVHQAVYMVNGCSDTLDVVIHPESLDLSDWTSCSTDEALPLPTPSPGAQWSGAGVSGSASSQTWNWLPSSAGAGEHSLIWSTPAGCTDTLWTSVEVAPNWPPPVAANADTVCNNSALWPPPVPGSAGNGPAPTDANWTVDGAPWPTNASTQTFGSGPHLIELQWTGDVCEVSDSWSVEVLPALEMALTASDSTLCPGAAVVLQIETSGGSEPPAGLSIAWSDGGLPQFERSIAPVSSAWWWASAEDGCSDPAADSVFIAVLPPFSRSIDFGPTACYGAETDAILDAIEPAGLMHIIEGDTLGPGPLALTFNAGSAVLWSLYDPLEGCAQDTLVLVPSHPPLNAAFSITPASDCIPWDSQPLRCIDLSNGADFGTWQWAPVDIASPPDGSPTTDTFDWTPATNPTLTLPSPGTWQITLALGQSEGCRDTTAQSICLLPPTDVWLPDAFSPNGDGSNDVFYPRGSGVKEWHITVRDRWGRTVWQETHGPFPSGVTLGTTDAQGWPAGWDGTAMNTGTPAAPGVYTVVFEATSDGGWPMGWQQPLKLIR